MSVTAAAPKATRVNMAGIGYGKDPDELETLLGSCIGVAVWDRITKIGGLAHVVLPVSHDTPRLPGKSADTAVAELRKQLLARGANPRTLIAKLVGGATMFGKPSDHDIGEKNYKAVVEHLKRYGIRVLAEHVGGTQGRLVRFLLRDGSLTVTVGRKQIAVL